MESHCCLALTGSMRLPGIMAVEMHSAQTVACASHSLKFKFRKRLVLEPASVVEMLPIGFGYDLPGDAPERIRAGIIPFVRRAYPELEEPVSRWLTDRPPGSDSPSTGT